MPLYLYDSTVCCISNNYHKSNVIESIVENLKQREVQFNVINARMEGLAKYTVRQMLRKHNNYTNQPKAASVILGFLITDGGSH